MNKRLQNSLSNLFVLLIIATVGIGIWQRQQITDWWRLRGYEAPTAIASLASNTAMNSHGTKLFYVYRPSLETKIEFRSKCSGFEQSIVLGCYISQRGLYILDVTDDRLHGVEEVTAAHEMLHVAWERLSGSEKQRIGQLLIAQEASLTDQRVKDTLASYRADPNADLDNEMHSIIGTEVATLSPELEAYYQQYFSDRQKVVTYAQAYASAFVQREQQIAAIDAELQAKEPKINDLKSQIASLSEDLARDRSEMEVLRENDPQAFNARVDSYNSSVRRFNRLIDQARTEINAYNELVQERNALALEEKSLIEALDTRAQSL